MLKKKSPYTGLKKIDAIAISSGVLVGCAVLVGVTVVVVIFIIKVSGQRILARRSRSLHLKTPLPFTITADKDSYHKIATPTPGDRVSDEMEFLRENIDFHEQLGKGRFGKVMRASAYCIVPQLPSVNTVAVKMAISKTSHSNKMILAELGIMKKMEAHKNICNLLAYCTTEDPVLIIVEFACHGNLKRHLELCSHAVLQLRKPLAVTDEDHGYLNIVDNEKAMMNRAPGFISESTVKQYSFQIASGLEHLESMEIVHRDLAARNILISEGFVLKIGDFGMATTISDDENYHKIIDHDGMVAVKWAALETLEDKGYFFKSDVWSYAVVVWEIASYGAEPFADVKVGLSLNKFIEHLQSGHRLPQPLGLSDSVYRMLSECWAKEVNDRPSPSLLKQFFQEEP